MSRKHIVRVESELFKSEHEKSKSIQREIIDSMGVLDSLAFYLNARIDILPVNTQTVYIFDIPTKVIVYVGTVQEVKEFMKDIRNWIEYTEFD